MTPIFSAGRAQASAVTAAEAYSYVGRMEAPRDTPRTEMLPLDQVATGSAVTPLSVWSGHKLRGNNRINGYIYQTDRLDAVLYRCNSSGCTELGRIGVDIRQNVTGSSSTRWSYAVKTTYISGPRYFGDVEYQCARNITGAQDNFCDNYRDNADGYAVENLVSSPGGQYTSTTTLSRSFGTAVGAKKYGMLRPLVKWYDYGVTARGDDGDYGFKFRMWDTKRFTTNDAHLEAATGTGT